MIILDSITWTDISISQCTKEKIPIVELLPSIGTEVVFEISGTSLSQEKAHFLWSPPHSDFNGFSDRPYEFIKTRIISGSLKLIPSTERSRYLKYKFTVESIALLSDVLLNFEYKKVIYAFNGKEICRNSFFPEDSSRISGWAYVGWCNFLGGGNLIYTYTVDYELREYSFILEKQGEYILLYEHVDVSGLSHGELMNVKLSEKEIKSLKEIMESKEPIDCSKKNNVADDEVQGAEWR